MSINIGPVGYGTYYYELNDSDHVLHLDNRKDVIYRSGVQVRISRFNSENRETNLSLRFDSSTFALYTFFKKSQLRPR